MGKVDGKVALVTGGKLSSIDYDSMLEYRPKNVIGEQVLMFAVFQ